jgi:choline kinase
MKAIILAAGIGKRLGQNFPKCLLEFQGKSLLQLHLEYLKSLEIERIGIVVGYQAQKIEEAIANLGYGDGVEIFYNPDYEKGSIVSMWSARAYLEGDRDILLMDADVLYEREILVKLVTTNKTNCFLLDRDFEMGEEPVKICIHNNQLVEFRKQLAPDLIYDTCGESVGFFRFDREIASRLWKRAQEYLEQGWEERPHEEAIRDILLETPEVFTWEDVTGLPWLEIDFPQDLDRAKDKILPQLKI